MCLAKYLLLLLSNLHWFHGVGTGVFVERLSDVSPNNQTNPDGK